jgi:tetratricopeptide (TPR) repeat protein
MREFLKCIVLAMLLASPAAAGSSGRTRVYARVEAETVISPGDEFAYAIVVEGGGEPSKIDVSPLASFKPRRLDSGSSMQTINGQTMVSHTQTYALTAGQAGTMTVPAVTVVVDGRTYTTNPVEVPIARPLVLDLSLSSKRCCVGEPVIMTVKWTVLARVEGGFNVEVPVFQSDDFQFEDVSGDTDPQRPSIHGVPVTVVQDRRNVQGVAGTTVSFTKVLIAKKAGPIKLNPVTVAANLAVGRVRTNSVFNPYMLKYERVSVQSEPMELEVLPLPEEGRPAEFYGLVGRYTISASAAPTKVSVGDPITLTVRIGGNPYLKPVQWPQLKQAPELAANFKIPAERASPTVENGQKVFTQTLRANSDTVKQIPPIPLAYFDSQAGRYVVARTDPIPLEVSPTRILTNADMEGGGGAPANGAGATRVSPVQAISKGLSANYYGPEILADQSFSLLSAVISPRYAAIWSIPLVALAASAVIRLAGRTSPELVARKRRRQAAGLALRRLKAMASGDDRQRPEQLLEAMKGYIGDRFDRVAASLTADECRDAIVQAIDDPTTAWRYRDLIAACEADRYAPLAAEIGSAQVQQAVELIAAVEKRLKPAGAGFKPASTHRTILLIVVLLGLGGPWSVARGSGHESPATSHDLYALLTEANAAFQQGNATAEDPAAARQSYDKAILLYERIIREGGVQNAGLYYNLANARLLTDDLGRAILNYRRAERLDGSDLNIKKNLAFARSRRIDRVETGTQERVLETLFFWHYDLSPQTRLLLACLAFASLCVALTIMVRLGRGTAPLTAAVLSGVLAVCLLASILIESHKQSAVRFGVITAAEIVARQGDGPNYPPSFQDPLHAGTEFELIEQRPGWFHLRLSDGTEAWVPEDAAEPV